MYFTHSRRKELMNKFTNLNSGNINATYSSLGTATGKSDDLGNVVTTCIVSHSTMVADDVSADGAMGIMICG